MSPNKLHFLCSQLPNRVPRTCLAFNLSGPLPSSKLLLLVLVRVTKARFALVPIHYIVSISLPLFQAVIVGIWNTEQALASVGNNVPLSCPVSLSAAITALSCEVWRPGRGVTGMRVIGMVGESVGRLLSLVRRRGDITGNLLLRELVPAHLETFQDSLSLITWHFPHKLEVLCHCWHCWALQELGLARHLQVGILIAVLRGVKCVGFIACVEPNGRSCGG